MTPDQRKALVQKFDSTKIKSATFSVLSSEPDLPCCSYSYQKGDSSGVRLDTASQKMSVSVENCNISTLPQATLSAMWNKAEEYSNGVLPAPGSNKKSKMMASHSGIAPHFITVSSSGQYCCDKNCIQWCSSKICSHTLVSAEVNGELQAFLQWYLDSCQEPNITQLANFGLPAGRGHKGGIAKRKRSKNVASSSAIVTQRPATVCTNSQQLVNQQGKPYLNTTNQDFQQCTVSQFEYQQPRVQEAIASQQAMVQQYDRHSTVTTSPTSVSCDPVNVHTSVQLTGHVQRNSSNSVCVSSRAAVSTIQQGCSLLQSNSIQSNNSSYVLSGNTNVISALPNQTLIFQNLSAPVVTSTLQLSPQPNTNPFHIK